MRRAPLFSFSPFLLFTFSPFLFIWNGNRIGIESPNGLTSIPCGFINEG